VGAGGAGSVLRDRWCGQLVVAMGKAARLLARAWTHRALGCTGIVSRTVAGRYRGAGVVVTVRGYPWMRGVEATVAGQQLREIIAAGVTEWGWGGHGGGYGPVTAPVTPPSGAPRWRGHADLPGAGSQTGWSRGIIGEYFAGDVLPPTDRFDVLTRLATARDRVEEHGRRRPPTNGGPRQPVAPTRLLGRVGCRPQRPTAVSTLAPEDRRGQQCPTGPPSPCPCMIDYRTS
jgi:hypothetical protein